MLLYRDLCWEVTIVDVGPICSLLFLIVFAHSVFFLLCLVTFLLHHVHYVSFCGEKIP